ncbi:hypothetical protein AB6A40_010805 [Gnathostoma spinigerum]|uniref:Acyltransferase 3 domain-containing protein n=1 Tax=Gnathostoma spinigerum TaxID=75299 RepID=A0ABD6EW28_9BILA
MFFIALLKSRFVGTVLIIINIVMSAVLRIIVMAIKQLPPAPLYWSTQPVFSGNYEEHYVNIYIKPWHRMGPYLIGIFLGYYLATTDVLVERTRPLTLMLAGWALTILLSFFAIFGLWPVLQGWNWPLYYFFYGAVHRTAFALSGAWLIYACHTDNGGYLNRFLKAKFFIPLSSLSYNIYLWHMPWIYALFTLLPFPITYRSHFPLFVLTTIALVLSCLVAFIFSLMAEIPAINLEKILLNPSLRQQRKNLPFSPVPTNEMDTVNAFQSAYKVDKEECWK